MTPPDNAMRNRIRQAAERLFASRGYASVTLRDIADAVGMKHASLYYYAPGGKKQLFLDVVRHSYDRHEHGLTAALAAADGSVLAQLYAASDWLVVEPSFDIARVHTGDRPELSDADMADLTARAFSSVGLPIVGVLQQGARHGQIVVDDAEMTAMALVNLTTSARNVPGLDAEGQRLLARRLVDLLMSGLLPRA